ncbi:MBL fold metallo-hydrolase [Azospirillum soli]|uniref:MBL fold metallo-hydrolase n=1 Tax=Azospirillum soli TaxID=1304799 RepID=UPI001AE1436E|nr:MBL fold metallo-hydrolase [Azospirillum soli]MBP2312193.1 glyoxylase-like metal-dependent hydrolase (beta-lactamase superfamily II) [Azospirillum soli]
MRATVQAFFHPPSSTISYVVYDRPGGAAAIVDSVLDFDGASGRLGTASADALAGFVAEQGLTVAWILETHIHADHLSAAHRLQDRLGGRIGIGARVAEVQTHFGKVFNAPLGPRRNGACFDRLFEDGEAFTVGDLDGEALHTPGHTPDSVSYRIGDALFVGDTLFMPDGGTARCDFPGGDARQMYCSLRRLLALPEETRVFVCHDYAPGGRSHAWETTVGEQRRANIHVRDGVDVESYVAMRAARDRTLSMPALIIPAVQVNVAAGRLPAPEANGAVYLKMPVNVL